MFRSGPSGHQKNEVIHEVTSILKFPNLNQNNRHNPFNLSSSVHTLASCVTAKCNSSSSVHPWLLSLLFNVLCKCKKSYCLKQQSQPPLSRFLLSQQLQSPINFTPALVTDPLIHQVSPAATTTAAPAASSLSRSSSSSAPAVPHHRLLLLLINAIQIAMSTEAAQQKNSAQIVRLDNAFKLAGQWVNNMSKAVEDEPAKVESEGRPSRLGLGAKEVPRHSKARMSNDPVERRLHAKLEAGKRRAAKIIENSIGPARDCNEDDDSDGELESRTSTFAKKRPGPQVQTLQAKKKQK